MTQLIGNKPCNPAKDNVEHEILRFAREQPQLGQAAVAQYLQQDGLKISPSGVRYIWKKHNLETTAKRLQALADSEQENVLSESQQQRLNRNQRTQDLRHTGLKTQEGESGRRTILLNTAAELFAEKGFDRTSMRDIASHSGLLPGSVYHHFSSKTELFLAIHQDGFNTVLQQVRKEADTGKDPWDSLARALGIHISYMVGDAPPVLRLTGQSLAMTDHPELHEQIRPYRAAYEDLIRQLITALPLRPGTDQTLLRLTLLGAGNWVFVWYRKEGKTPKEIARLMVKMLRDGVGADLP